MVYKKEQWGTDKIMLKTWFCLANDFEAFYGPSAFQDAKNALVSGIKEFRAYKWPARSQVKPHLFKCMAQLENLNKRYRYEDDLYTDAQLETMAKDKFLETQTRVSLPLTLTPTVRMWLVEARKICTSILGEYSEEEHFSLCRFGKRACVGVPKSKSYLDFKLGHPLTSSKYHIAWFTKYLETDPLLTEIVKPKGLVECDTLALAFAPKSFKARRTICANTLVGSFYTYGLGKVFQERLAGVGLDIRSLQLRHGHLAKKNSRSRDLVTADLSSASDSLSRELLRRLLPAKWYSATIRGSIPYVRIDGERVRLSSVLTMGLGHTFPLQTLIYYALLKSLVNLVKPRLKFVSVYGDDLIYPRQIHKYVRKLFPHIHLILNEDKTYVEDFFRESCGNDYCRGVDVRPHQPEGGRELYCRKGISTFLYKLLNGLKRKWTEVEIPLTLDYLLTEIYHFSDEGVLQVPSSFPDGSGLKTDYPSRASLYKPVVWNRFGWTFESLTTHSGFRKVRNQLPYYWERLRSSNNLEIDDESFESVPSDEPILVWRKIQNPHGRGRVLQAGVMRKDDISYGSHQRRINEWV